MDMPSITIVGIGAILNDPGFATIFPEDIANMTEVIEKMPSRPLILEYNGADHPTGQLSEHAMRAY